MPHLLWRISFSRRLDGGHAQGFGKTRFGAPAAVNIGVIKEVDAFIQRGMHQRGDFLVCHVRDAHTTQGYFRCVEIEFCDFHLVHQCHSLLNSDEFKIQVGIIHPAF